MSQRVRACVYVCMCDVSGVLMYGRGWCCVTACMYVCVCMCACVYACLFDVFGVLMVWSWLRLCYCVYACLSVLVHVCLRGCVVYLAY